MGLFGNKKEENKDPEKYIPVVTMNYYPNREFEELTLLGIEVMKPANSNPIVAAQKIAAAARKYNADAVIGFRCNVFLNSTRWVSMSAYGTAIRFTDGKGDPNNPLIPAKEEANADSDD